MRAKSRAPILLTVLIALLGGALGWWMLQGAETVDWEEIAYESAGEIDGAGTLESEDLRRESTPETGWLEDTGDPLRSAIPGRRVSPREVTAPSRATDLEKGFQVRVVDAETQGAVAGADVFFFDTLSPQYPKFRKQLGRYRVDKEVGLEAAGERVVTDAHGFATLPHGIPSQAVVARKDDLYGELRVLGEKPKPATGYVLELQPDRTLRVKVVDATGMGVTDVGLVFFTPPPRGRSLWGSLELRPAEVTADGVRRYTHVQELAARLRRDCPLGPLLRLGLRVPGLEEAGPVVSLAELPEDPVEIERPATGSVRVRVLDEDGEPFMRQVELTVLRPADDPAKMAGPRWIQKTDAQGEVLFPRVALGQRFQVKSRGREVGPDEVAEFAGPRDPENPVVVTLTKNFTAAQIEGVALDHQDRPLVKSLLRYAANARRPAKATGALLAGTVRTDASGRFVIRLPPTVRRTDAKGKAFEANLYRGLKLAFGGDPKRSGTSVRVLPHLNASRYDVGAIRLRQPELIASGKVWIDGKPARGFDRFVLDWRNPKKKNRRERIADLLIKSGPEGRFEIRGDLGGRDVRLRARTWGFFPVPAVQLRRGMHDLEFRLVSGGSVRAALLFDPGVYGAPIEVQLVPTQLDTVRPSQALRSLCIGRVDRRGTGNPRYRTAYWWAGLPKGVYRLEVRLLGASQPCRVIEGIEPSFGQRMDSLWALEVSLIGAIERIELRVRDKRGRALSALAIPVGQTAGVREAVQIGRQGAQMFHCVEAGRPDLQIVAKGYAPTILRGATGKQTVTLYPGAQVTVAVTTPKPPKGVGLRVSLRRRGEGESLLRAGLRYAARPKVGARSLSVLLRERTLPLRRKGKLWRGTISQPGVFDVWVEVALRGVKRRVRITEIQPVQLRIQNAKVARRFDVVVTATAWADALRQLGVDPAAAAKRQRKK